MSRPSETVLLCAADYSQTLSFKDTNALTLHLSLGGYGPLSAYFEVLVFALVQ